MLKLNSCIQLSKFILTLTLLVFFAKNVSADVRTAQDYLNKLGYDAGSADGMWGPKTETALKQFLNDNGKSWDGKFDKSEFGLLTATIKKKGLLEEIVDFGWNIPERPKTKPNDATLAHYLRKDILEGKGIRRDVTGIPSITISGSRSPRKLRYADQTDTNVEKELNKTALISYLYYENGVVVNDQISPRNRFGSVFDSKTRLIGNSISKSVVAYLAIHAICDGYIPNLDHELSDWPLLKDTLYNSATLREVMDMRSGDQKFMEYKGGIKGSRFGNPHDRTIKSIMENELSGSTPSAKKFNYNNLNLNVAFNYVIHKSGNDFNRFASRVFQNHIGIEHPVVFVGKYRDDLTRETATRANGGASAHFFASRQDYLRFAIAMLDDWEKNECVGKHLKDILGNSQRKGEKPGSGPFANFRGYSSFFHTEFIGFPRRKVLGMDGYGGQMIWIDFEERKIVATNAIHLNYNWKKIVANKIKG